MIYNIHNLSYKILYITSNEIIMTISFSTQLSLLYSAYVINMCRLKEHYWCCSNVFVIEVRVCSAYIFKVIWKYPQGIIIIFLYNVEFHRVMWL